MTDTTTNFSDDPTAALGKLAVDRKMITPEQLDKCRDLIRKSKKIGLATTVKEVLLKQQFMTPEQFQELEHIGELAEEGSAFGSYRLVKCLGQGGMGKVYHAYHEFINRPVAIKVISDAQTREPSSAARYFQEVRALAKLDHPNITRIFDAGRVKRRFYFTMELVEGQSLRRYVDEKGPLDQKEAVRIIRQVALALGHAHANNVVHRDVKPENIIIDPRGVPKLTDFGVVMHHDEDHMTLTQQGVLVGSYHYVAPEQVDGVRDIDGRADQYSLGATFYYALAARTLYDGTSPGDILAQQLAGNWVSPRVYNHSVSRRTVAVLKRMLARNRDKRYPNMEALVKALDSVPFMSRVKKAATLAGTGVLLVAAGMLIERFWQVLGSLF